jgi:glycosyltransferase involved in cell wall biosynthesis
MRKVMIGTPCYSGSVDVWYTNSLVNTIKLSYEKGVEIIPMWVSFDALIQRARNDTIQIALDLGVDDLIWIDSDIEWEPEWFFKLLEYPVDVVGGTYRKKGDREEYVYRPSTNTRPDPATGLIENTGLGTGFVRMSKSAMQYLWDTSKPYIDPKDNRERRMIFDVVIENGNLVSEDINAFFKLSKGGFKIWMDPAMTCNHIGPYKFKGDYQQWAKSGRNPNNITAPAIVKSAPQLPRRQL